MRIWLGLITLVTSGVATGVRGCGPHRAALARGGKGAKTPKIGKKIYVEIQIVSFMCLRARKTKLLCTAKC